MPRVCGKVRGSRYKKKDEGSEVANVQINLSTDVKGSLPPARIDLSQDFNFTGNVFKSSAPLATQAYADALKAGLAPKDEVDAATTANITLSGAQTIDGVSVTAGMRVLVKNQSTASQNGVYIAASGSWTRATDFDADSDVTNGALIPVKAGGTANGSLFFLMLTADPTIGTTSISFTQFPSSGASAGVDGDITTIAAGTTADAGSSGAFAPADHAHAVSTAAPADLLESSSSSSEGSGGALARAAHVHAFPDMGKEGASTLLANLQRRTAELHRLPPTNGVVVDTGGGSQNGDTTQAGTPGMSVVVAAVKVYNGNNYSRANVPAGNQSVSLDAADAVDPRYDAIVIPAGTGGVSPTKRTGTPASSPSLPSLTSGDTLIYVVKVAALDTAITNAEIFDHRRYSNPQSRSETFTADGSTSAFTLARRVYGEVKVYRDGLRMEAGSDSDYSHYQVSEPIEANGTRITFGANPTNGAVIRIDYDA